MEATDVARQQMTWNYLYRQTTSHELPGAPVSNHDLAAAFPVLIAQPPETQVIAAEEAKQRRSVLLALTALAQAESIDQISPAAVRLIGTYGNSPVCATMKA